METIELSLNLSRFPYPFVTLSFHALVPVVIGNKINFCICNYIFFPFLEHFNYLGYLYISFSYCLFISNYAIYFDNDNLY